MEALVHEGRVRAIGVSNFSESQIKEILSFATVPPAVNQVRIVRRIACAMRSPHYKCF